MKAALIVLGIFLLIFAVGGTGFIWGQTYKISTTSTPQAIPVATTSNLNSLPDQEDLTTNQENCNKMMQSIADNYGSTASNQWYTDTNHYNTSLNKCYVELDQNVITPSGSLVTFYSIYDAVENNVVAHCNSNNSSGNNACTENSSTDNFYQDENKYMTN